MTKASPNPIYKLGGGFFMQQEIKETALKDIEGTPLILDIRSNQDYQNLHLKQPHIHIPAANLDIPSFLKTTPIKEHQHLYLLSQTGASSHIVAKRFLKAGFQNIVNIQGGILKSKTDGIATQMHEGWHFKRVCYFSAGVLIFVGVLLALFVHQNFYLIPLGVGFFLILQSIIGKTLFSPFFKRKEH